MYIKATGILLNLKFMNKPLIIICIIAFAINSCTTKSNDLSGSYETIDEKQLLQVKRITDKEYEITSPYDSTKLIFTRNGDTLYSSFKKQQLTCEFNHTYDTLFGKEDGNISITCVKVKK